MIVKTLLKPSEYHDSVSLMLAARELSKLDGVRDAAVVMATESNKSILAEAGLLTLEAEAATPNDLLIAVSAESEVLADTALQKADGLLKKKAVADETGEFHPKTLHGALAAHPDANVVVISVAGRYAADEAWDALQRGLHVLLFSDNVSLEDEIALKKYARAHGLLLMGPGAGTVLLNGVALGFANVLPHGPVGIVSAAGTGLQEVSTLLAKRGVGITQGIGTGGRDLKEAVGGLMMLSGLQALQSDPATEVIVLISKPPADVIAQKVLEQVEKNDKPTVVCFLGSTPVMKKNGIKFAQTLEEAAILTAALATNSSISSPEPLSPVTYHLLSNQRYLRAFFSGGTLCYEAQVIWKDMLAEPVYSNAPLPGGPVLTDFTKSQGHTAVDLGEEEFTVGRPHPMIDNDLRIRRLLQEAYDPEVAVILLDVVIGYGAHPDPAAELAPAIHQAKEIAHQAGRELPVFASVTGTEQDPQCLSLQVAALESIGVVVCESNAGAARLAGQVVSNQKIGRG